jgi:hypothetical protein
MYNDTMNPDFAFKFFLILLVAAIFESIFRPPLQHEGFSCCEILVFQGGPYVETIVLLVPIIQNSHVLWVLYCAFSYYNDKISF